MREDHDFDRATAEFRAWFNALPGASFSPDIAIMDLRARGAGRGIVALADIPADTVLFTIPRSGILSVQTSDLANAIPSIFDHLSDSDHEHDDPSHDPWIHLVLVLIYEHLRAEPSAWRPYLDLLPPTFDTPMFWPESELAELQASPLVARVGRPLAESIFRYRIIPMIRQHESVFFRPGKEALTDGEIIDLAHRMGSAVMAYSFNLEEDDEDDDDDDEEEDQEEEEGQGEGKGKGVGNTEDNTDKVEEGEGEDEGWVAEQADEERKEGELEADEQSQDEDGWVEEKQSIMGMVPMADMLNSDAEFNAHVNHGTDSLTVVSLRPIRPGEELLNYYGPRPNSELLRQYGYVTAKHSRYDVVEIPWSLINIALRGLLNVSDSTWKKLLESVEQIDCLQDSFVLERDCGPVNPDGTFARPATLTEIPPDLIRQIKAVLKAAHKLDARIIPNKRKRDKICEAAVARCLDLAAARYPTTREDDEKMLAGGRDLLLPPRMRMALLVRLGEKVLLEEARQLIRSKGGRAPDDSGDDVQRPKRAKKQNT